MPYLVVVCQVFAANFGQFYDIVENWAHQMF